MATSDTSQLPSNVRPLKYKLALTPDMRLFTFSGKENIDVEIRNPTTGIKLNSIEIEIQTASVRLSDGTIIPSKEIVFDEDNETVEIVFNNQLEVGKAELNIEFSGELNDRLQGFYRSSYISPDGAEQILATTQFEATDARRAFPCWDEPALKASFEVTLTIPSHLSAVSNTPILHEEAAGKNYKRVVFRETPPMSTYLLAFVVGQMESIEGTSKSGTRIGIWTTPGKSEQGRFALETAIRLLDYYNDYFGIPYPLEKLDHLGIPDFAAGAMENWGAITYREAALLFDPEISAPGTRQRIAEIVAHEMAHMWFGDLVTMAWWNDLWLNESFASWMATKAVDHLFPDWEIWTQFIYDDVNAGLGLDGLENSHPIEANVHNPAEIQQLFDPISYSKGASIIRMLEQFLGAELFKKGLRRYLSDHSYSNAKTQDLWEAMEAESKQPVTTIMNSWVSQTGYPVLQAEILRGKEAISVSVSQNRFLYTGHTSDPTLWHVPLRISGQGASGTDTILLSERAGRINLDKAMPATEQGWVKVNTAQTGFYRVQYKEEEWSKFKNAITSLEMSAPDRLGLQGDAFALTRARLLPATQFLDLAQAYINETEFAVWVDFGANLRKLSSLLANEPCHKQFQTFARNLLKPISQQIGWEPQAGEGHLKTLLRSTVLGHIGMLGDDKTLKEAQLRFELFLEHPVSLSADIRAVVYALAAQEGDASTHNTLLRLAQEATLQEEKIRLLMSLARFKDPVLLQRTLELSLSPEVRSQDTVSLVSSVAGNIHGGAEMAWEFVKSNWKEFDRRYGSGGFAIMRLVGITGEFTTNEARAEVESFFKSNPTPSATRSIQQSLERIDLNVRWLERNQAELSQWFKQ
jgi:puromycin-sensitive aminopeptidase